MIAVCGLTSVGEMVLVNFVIDSDFRWPLLALALLWATATILCYRPRQHRIVALVEAVQESLHLPLRHCTLLVLLTPPVPGHAFRLVDRKHGCYEQYQEGGTGVEQRGCVPH